MSVIELLTENAKDSVALRGVRLESRIVGTSMRTMVEQTFINMERRKIEAIYTFPLPADAAVCGFEVITGDRVLTGQIDESQQAIDEYEKALGQGHGAFLMEGHRPDVFSIRVGNLKPRQAVTIRLTYVTRLEVVDRSIRVVFPTTVAPRYAGGDGMDPMQAMVDGDALNPPHALWAPYGLTLDLQIAPGRPIRQLRSPSHNIVVRQDDGRYHVTLAEGLTEMNRDVIVELALAQDSQPCVQVTRRGEETFAAVTFLPEFEAAESNTQPSDVVFVLDCSGSMQGRSIEQAKRALELCLRSLGKGDRFNICRFGSTFELMSPEPLVYGEPTFRTALEYVRRIDADLGGTEILQPLQAILRKNGRAGIQDVILLTDGQVSNEPAVLALAAERAGGNRIFSFGIGAAPSQALVKGLARTTGGAAEFIADNERIEDKVLRTFGRLASPAVTDVRIDWGGTQVEQAPSTCPPVFDGDAVCVYGRVKGELASAVTLHCTTPSGKRSWTAPLVEAGDGQVLPLLWARTQIQQLEDQAPAGLSRPRRGHAATEDEVRSKLVAISKEFGLLCRETSFVAIEHRSLEERTSGQPAIRRVPVQLAQHWHGIDAMMPMACFDAAPAVGAAFASGARLRQKASPGPFFQLARASEAGPSMASIDAELAVPPVPSGDLVLDLLSLQRPDGGFDDAPWLSARLAEAWTKLDAWRKSLADGLAARGWACTDAILRDLSVMLLLTVKHANDRRQWLRAYGKARKHLAESLGVSPGDIDKLIAELAGH